MGQELLEITWDCFKTLEDRIVEEDKEEIIEMKPIAKKEVWVGPELDHFQRVIIGVTEA